MITHPTIRLAVANMFIEDYKMTPDAAFDATILFLNRLHARNMDVIKGDWMASAQKLNDRTPRFDWNDVARQVDELEASGHAPWNAPELRG